MTKIRKILFYLIILLVLTDILYSFIQHYNVELDGDVPESVLPIEDMQYTFSDCLGIKTILTNTPHAAPNRFFSHWMENRWFNIVPFVLQKIIDPIHSVYISSALYKIIIQLLLIYLLTVITFQSFKPFKELKHWFAILFYCALFQSCGYVRNMGIIDPAVTYTFFYAMPLLFLVIYLLPYIFEEFYNKKIIKNKIISIVHFIIFVFLSCLSGPVNTGIALCFVLIMFVRYLVQYIHSINSTTFNLKTFLFDFIPKNFYKYMIPLTLLSLYSLFLGSYNTMSWYDVSLKERYLLLPKGVFDMFFSNLGFSILTLGCVINSVLLILTKSNKGKKTTYIFTYIVLFTILYIILLPFGGYRPYRPFIIRYDTIICITFAFIFYQVYSTTILLKYLSKFKTAYISYIIIFIGYFFVVDDLAAWRNDCELNSMYYIAQSKEDVVEIPWQCNIISWNVANSPQESENAAKCMQLWNITDKKKLFYCKKTNE